MDFPQSMMEPTDEASVLDTGILPEEQDLETLLRELDQSFTNPVSFDNDSLSNLFSFEDEGNDESSDQPLQVANPHETLQQQQQQASQVVLIDGSGERLDPTDPETNFTVQEEMAEINSMTASEFDKVKSDLHGITNDMSNLGIRDTSLNLQRMNYELSKLPPEQTASYSRALKECPGLVSDKRKVAFLQREDNDPALAAVRFASFWENRLELFGPERCFLPMTLSGAMKGEAKNLMERRTVQLLPVKDTAGRAVLFVDPSRRDFTKYSVEQGVMATWYLLEVAMEDPVVRKRGVVFIYDANVIEPKQFSRKLSMWFVERIDNAFPIHTRAMHICYPNFFVTFFVVPTVRLLLGRKTRQRFQLHNGSTAEVLKSFEGFCLPKHRLPTDVGGDISLDMTKWVSERRALEESRPDPRFVSDQQPSDGPTSKRVQSKITTVTPKAEDTMPTTEHQNAQRRKRGRPSDPRMERAIEARLTNPDLSPQEALEMSGFVFISTDETGEPIDADNITLAQRKNHLSRRIRQLIGKQGQRRLKHTPAQSPAGVYGRGANGGDSSTSALYYAPASATTVNEARLTERRDSFEEAISGILRLDDLFRPSSS